MQADLGQGSAPIHFRQALGGAVLVDLAGHGDQIGKHGIADRRGHGHVGQGIEADIDHPALPDHLTPVEDGAGIVDVQIVRGDQFGGGPGGELLQQGQQARHDLVEIGLVVLERAAQAIGHRVIKPLVLDILDQGDGDAVAPAQGHGQIAVIERTGAPRYLLLPAGRRHAGEPLPVVVLQQRIDVGNVPHDLVVIRPPAQRHQGAGDDVGEAPGEFPEGGAVALVGQLVGNAGCHLGDAGERAHRVVARADAWIAQMEDIDLLLPAGAPGLGIDPLEQVGVALGVEHDHHIAAADVLGDQDLGQPGLADPGGSEHEGVPYALAEIHPHVLLLRLHAVQGGIAADRRQRCERIPAAAAAQPPAQRRQQERTLPGDFLAPRPAIERAGLHIAPHLGTQGVAQALGVFLCPAKAAAQKQLVPAHGNAVGSQAVDTQPAQVALVVHHGVGLPAAPDGQCPEPGGGRKAHRRRHHHRPGRRQADDRGGARDHRGINLHRRAQQGLDGMLPAHCSTPSREINTG